MDDRQNDFFVNGVAMGVEGERQRCLGIVRELRRRCASLSGRYGSTVAEVFLENAEACIADPTMVWQGEEPAETEARERLAKDLRILRQALLGEP